MADDSMALIELAEKHGDGTFFGSWGSGRSSG